MGMTGNAVVDAVGKMNFSGNIIPHVWFQTIVGDNGKPSMTACMLLSDIVYWYRPSEIRDQESGKFMEYRKKIRGDLLQRSYEDLGEVFNLTKRQVKSAIVLLEDLGVIKRVFRTVTLKGGLRANNVMFIQLFPERLQELTYPEDDEKKVDIIVEEDLVADEEEALEEKDKEPYRSAGAECDTPMTKKRHRSVQKTSDLYTEKCHRSVQKTSDKYIDYIETTTKTVINPILSSSPDERESFCRMYKGRIGYDDIYSAFCKTPQANAVRSVLDLCVEVASDVYFATGRYQRVGCRDEPTVIVKKIMMGLDSGHIYQVVRGFLGVQTEVRNIRAYLLTSMVNIYRSMPAITENKINVMLRETEG